MDSANIIPANTNTGINTIHEQYKAAAKTSMENMQQERIASKKIRSSSSIQVKNVNDTSNANVALVSVPENPSLAQSLPVLPSPAGNIETLKSAQTGTEQDIAALVVKVKEEIISENNQIYSILSTLLASGAENSSSLSLVTQSVLESSIKNSQATIKKLQTKIYNANHQTTWQKISSFFSKAFSFITNIFKKMIIAILGKTLGNKVTGWFDTLNNKLLTFITKTLGGFLKKMGFSNSAIAGITEAVDIIVDAVIRSIMPPFLMFTGAVPMGMPGSSITSAISSSASVVASYAKNTLNDPSLAGKIKLSGTILSAIVNITIAIAMTVLTGGAASGEVVADITETAVDVVDDAASSFEGAAGDLGEDGSSAGEGESNAGEDESTGETSSNNINPDDFEQTVDEEEEESTIEQDSSNKVMRAAKQLLSKIQNLVKDKSALEKLVKNVMAVAAALQGVAGIMTGIKDITTAKLQQGIASLYQGKANIDALSETLSGALNVQSKENASGRVYMASILKNIQSLSGDISSVLNSQNVDTRNVTNW